MLRVIRLLASDLDGTLLADDDRPSARTLAALDGAAGAGWTVVLATGRPPRFLDPAARDLRLPGVAICNNGATVYDPSSRRVLSEAGMAEAVAREVVGRLRRFDGDLLFSADWGLELAAEPEWAERTRWFMPPDARIGPVERLLDGPVAKLLAWHPTASSDALAAAARPLVADLVDVTSSTGYGVIEITAPGVSKGAAVARFASERGIEPDEVVAFGDMPNDTTMLTWAGLGVAMGNAHPEVVAAADEVTASNVDDGVARVVERLLGVRSVA